MADQSQEDTAPQTFAALRAMVEESRDNSRRAADWSLKAYEQAKKWEPVERRVNVSLALMLLLSFGSMLVSLAAVAHVY